MSGTKSVEAFAAKRHFSALLGQVEAGESFVITKRGQPVAQLVPFTVARARQSLDELRTRAATLRQTIRVSAAEIRGWVDEGRL